jgi:hypothetical protein
VHDLFQQQANLMSQLRRWARTSGAVASAV